MKKFVLGVTLLTLAAAAHAQSLQTASVNGMNYEVLLPPGYNSSQSYPAMLFLTPLDQGDNPDYVNQTYIPQFQAMQAAHPSIIVIPLLNQTADPSGQTINFGGVTGSTAGEQNAVAAMQQVMTTYNVNKSQVYAEGGSMGGQGTDQIMVDHGPNSPSPIFAAGISMAGTMINMTPATAAAALGNTPIIAIHGSNDTTNLPGWDEAMAQIDPNFHLTMVQGAGHDVWDGSTGIGNTAALNQLFGYTLNGAATTPVTQAVAGTAAAAPAATTAPATPPAAASVQPAAGDDQSPQSATIKPGSGSITDADGHVWTISASGSIMEDGQYTPGGGGTAALTIGADGTVYGQDSGHGPVNAGGWFTLSGNSWQVSAAPGTTASPAPPTTSTTAAIAPAVAVCGSGVPSGAFKIVGGRIIGPDGKDYIGRGINLYDSQLGDIDAIIAMFPGINFFRISVGHDGYHDPSYYQDFITKATTAGRVVELEHHPDGGGGQDPAYTGSDLANENAWYASVGKAFANNPYVWFGTFNEPGTQGGSVSAWELQTYNAIRGAGNNSIILLEIVGWPGAWNNSMNASDFAGMHNTVWDTHFYGWVPRYSTDQATVDQALADEIAGAQQIPSADGTMPAMIAEYGNSTAGVSIDPNGEQTVAAVITAGANGKFGSAAWAWLPGGSSDHLQDGGNLTDPYGIQVQLFINNHVTPCTATESATNAQSTLDQITAQVAGATPPADPTTPATTPAESTPAPDPSVQAQIAAADAAIAQANAILAKLGVAQ